VKGEEQTEQRKLPHNTMKTDKNSRTTTAEGALLQPEQACPDTNPPKKLGKYRVVLFWTHTESERATLTIEAHSQEEANQKAEEIMPDDLSDDDLDGVRLDGGFFDEFISVHSVEPIVGGEAND